MFQRVLIANRGEIARRLIRAVRSVGAESVAVFSDADRFSPHVLEADHAFELENAPSPAPVHTYLSVDRVLQIAERAKVGAVHPGYGFLSESPQLAARLEEKGIAFVGPPVNAIRMMGDKLESKRIARAAGVSVIPGGSGAVQNAHDAASAAQELGYPVMLKASAGGGGKGMRVIDSEQMMLEDFPRCQAEAEASFGDGTMLVEKFISRPRHIEIQILVDKNGHGVFFPERECSLQRRNQKVIEESPSPLFSHHPHAAEIRAEMGRQALALAAAVGYYSAGTIEYLVSGDDAREFYFLEMNTRLQVEHPVTEAVSGGVDLAQWMLRIAAGEELSLEQKNLNEAKCHAFEARIYAEDATKDFSPCIGTISAYREPAKDEMSFSSHSSQSSSGTFSASASEVDRLRALGFGSSGVRVDSGVVDGSAVGVFYDPLLAKLITVGTDRSSALATLQHALDRFVLHGVRTNLGFLYDLTEDCAVRGGGTDMTTQRFQQRWPNGYERLPLSKQESRDVALLLAADYFSRTAASAQVSVNYDKTSGLIPSAENKDESELGMEEHIIEREVVADSFESFWSEHCGVRARILRGVVRGSQREIVAQVMRPGMYNSGTCGELLIVCRGHEHHFEVYTPEIANLLSQLETRLVGRFGKSDRMQSGGDSVDERGFFQCRAPMAGVVREVHVSENDKVTAEESLLVLEAMKMRSVVRSRRSCTVRDVMVRPGDIVTHEQPLISYSKE